MHALAVHDTGVLGADADRRVELMQRDRDALVQDLRRLVGDEHVLIEDADVIVYEQDGSILQAMPEIVVLPADAPQVAEVVRAARRAAAAF